MAAPIVSGCLQITEVHQKPPASFTTAVVVKINFKRDGAILTLLEWCCQRLMDYTRYKV